MGLMVVSNLATKTTKKQQQKQQQKQKRLINNINTRGASQLLYVLDACSCTNGVFFAQYMCIYCKYKKFAQTSEASKQHQNYNPTRLMETTNNHSIIFSCTRFSYE